MSRRWLGFFLLVLIVSGAYATEPGNATAITSVLVPAATDGQLAFAVSPGRQDLYAVTWRQPSGTELFSDATLRVIGVADPGKPVPRVSIPLGDLAVLSMVARGARLFILAMTPSPQIPIPAVRHQTQHLQRHGLEVVVADVSKPEVPVVVSRTPVQGTELEAARDGACFATHAGMVGHPGRLDSYVIDAQGTIAAGDCGTSEPRSQPEAVRFESVVDELGPDRLVRSAGRWFIRTTAGASTADRRVAVPGSGVLSATFLATSGAVAASLFDVQAKTFQLVVLDTSRPAFDPARLRQADAELTNEHAGLRGASSGRVNPFIAEDLAARLNEAGAQQALARSPEELRRWGLVPVLNNWGYWQSLGHNPAVALPTLQRVVEIAPERAVAWRNLGDAARASLPGDLSDAERVRLTRLALDAYSTYQRLTGRKEASVADFTAFNALTASQLDPCHLVVEYYRRGRQREIDGVEQPVHVNGGRLWLTITYEGTAHIAAVEATDASGQEVEQASFGLAAAPKNAMTSNIVLISSGGTVYGVLEQSGVPVAVGDWDGRQLCRFSADVSAPDSAGRVELHLLKP